MRYTYFSSGGEGPEYHILGGRTCIVIQSMAPPLEVEASLVADLHNWSGGKCINCRSTRSQLRPVFVHKAFVLRVYLDSPFVPRLEMV